MENVKVVSDIRKDRSYCRMQGLNVWPVEVVKRISIGHGVDMMEDLICVTQICIVNFS